MLFDAPPPMKLGLGLLFSGKRPGPDADAPRLEARQDRAADPARLDRWRRCCGQAAGPTMPLLWPQVLAGPLHFALLTHPEFPFPVPGIVHLANRFERRAPIPAGAPLSLTAWTEGFSRTHAGATFVIHTEARVAAGTEASTAGEPIWASTMTVLSRALPGQGERPPKQEEPAVAAARSAVWAVPADQGRRYAAASGDSNPIHTSAIFARISGFPRPIAHGMWTLGRALAELDTDLPEVCALEVQFRSPLLLPSRVCFEGGPEGRGGRFRVWQKKTILSGEWKVQAH